MKQTVVLQNIEKMLHQFPESLQIEVLHYVEYLGSKYVKQSNENVSDFPPEDNTQTSEKEQTKKRRDGFGIWKGKISMADDFDAPLEEFEEYM
ncbi:DUF2281 domain-containing protein [Floridanema aerugineum]|jgi:hypothetical protein|uniref:DUF2281 domain-containing protein n=1 Tax=Floridaenema aerugineum BLCC-F46 TaxID=3153654 RepID=A0ABV4X568_9CYAN